MDDPDPARPAADLSQDIVGEEHRAALPGGGAPAEARGISTIPAR